MPWRLSCTCQWPASPSESTKLIARVCQQLQEEESLGLAQVSCAQNLFRQGLGGFEFAGEDERIDDSSTQLEAGAVLDRSTEAALPTAVEQAPRHAQSFVDLARTSESIDLLEDLDVAPLPEIEGGHPAAKRHLIPLGHRGNGHAVDVAHSHQPGEARLRQAVLDAREVRLRNLLRESGRHLFDGVEREPPPFAELSQVAPERLAAAFLFALFQSNPPAFSEHHCSSLAVI